jgi:hypothetical protein
MCSICAEESTRICARCTKDACNNHLCEKCLRCSDCCECEVTLSDGNHVMTAASARAVIQAAKSEPLPIPSPEPEPELPHPPPDPDPFPEDDPEVPAVP